MSSISVSARPTARCDGISSTSVTGPRRRASSSSPRRRTARARAIPPAWDRPSASARERCRDGTGTSTNAALSPSAWRTAAASCCAGRAARPSGSGGTALRRRGYRASSRSSGSSFPDSRSRAFARAWSTTARGISRRDRRSNCHLYGQCQSSIGDTRGSAGPSCIPSRRRCTRSCASPISSVSRSLASSICRCEGTSARMRGKRPAPIRRARASSPISTASPRPPTR